MTLKRGIRRFVGLLALVTGVPVFFVSLPWVGMAALDEWVKKVLKVEGDE